LDQAISEGEVRNAMRLMPLGKIPGQDGIPLEFYITFQDLTVPLLTQTYIAAWEVGSLPLDFLKGNIVLLPKKGDSLLLNNKFPITLLTTKYKILAKKWQLCLRTAAEALISWNQIAFFPSRSIHHLVFFCSEALHFAELYQIPIVFLKIDFKKAYNKVQWSFLRQLFHRLGFSQKFLQPLSTLTVGSTSQLLVNGQRGKPFPIGQSVRQGCPLSPTLFIFVMQVLATCIASEHASWLLLLCSHSINDIGLHTSLLCG
jgi:hypothetical protein